jgi:hypothetical protein
MLFNITNDSSRAVRGCLSQRASVMQICLFFRISTPLTLRTVCLRLRQEITLQLARYYSGWQVPCTC